MNKTTSIVLATSIIGFIDSAYLTYVKLANKIVYCTPGLGDCSSVQNSRWSMIGGIPLALLGMLAFLSIILVLFLEKRGVLSSKYSDYSLFGLSCFGFLFSMFLTGVQIFEIHAFCQWCILSALCMTLIFITTIVRLTIQQNRPNK